MSIESNFRHWWKSPKKQTHENVYQYLQHLDNSQSYRSTDNLRHMRLYGDYAFVGLDSYSYSRVESSHRINHRVTLNIVQSMVDTAISKITKNKPRPTFLTDGGNWSLQQKAKKLSKFCEGIFYDTGLYEEGVKAFTDACIFGTGCIKIFADDGKICAERVLIEEIKVDDAEAFYGKPRQIHQVKFIHKDVLKEQFPDCAASIEQSSDMAPMSGSTYSNAKDMIKVIESWRLPSSKNANDGKHAITIQNCTLFEEEYKKQRFPFVFIRWTERPIGFFGKGISEQLQGIQLEINKILRTIQVSMHLTSIPKVFVEASSKVVTSHLNNKIGGIIKYAGTKPSYESVGSIPGELFSHLDRLYNRAYEIIGISSLSARSEKPAGLDSGKALRDFNDIESERFLAVGKRYEQMFIDASELILDLAKEIYEDTGELKVRVKGEKFVETIDWSEVDMDEDKYMMQIFPTSSLSNTPSGRLQDVQELLQAGFISKQDGKKLLDFPDLESVMNLETANLENIERQIDIMINKGTYEAPEPYQDLELAVQKVQQAYLYYRHQDAPEERLELLRNYIEDAQGLIQQMAQAQVGIAENAQIAEQVANAPMPEAVPAEEPIAVPEAQPTSDILPVT
jgi:hypothetical protein